MGRVHHSEDDKRLTGAELIPGLPVKPRGLSEQAALEWDRLLEEMQASGIVLIPAYRAALSMAATLMADLHVAWEDIRQNGRYTASRTGVRKLNPAVEDTAKLNEKLSKALWQLGLTPRARGNTPAPKKEEGPSLEDILNG